MSTRSNLRPQSVITNGDMSGSLTSTPTVLQSLSKVGYSLAWAGSSPVGTAEVQVSNDYSIGPTGVVVNTGTWTTLVLSVAGTPSTTIPITGAPGTAFIDVDVIAAYAIRLVYTRVSGTGTLNVVINGKVS